VINNVNKKLSSNWVTGFVDGEGCFSVYIIKDMSNKIGYSTRLQIIVSQHSRDTQLMNNVRNVLNCGYINKCSSRNAVELRIS